MRGEYEVTWGMIYEAESPADAVRQALGDLAQVIALPTEGPNTFVARRYIDEKFDEMTVVDAGDIDVDTLIEE